MKLCCIVKPSALQASLAILDALETSGVRVEASREIIYSVELIHALYDHMETRTRDAIAERFDGKPGLALLVEAQSIERLLLVAGSSSDPRACAPGTIRERFGQKGEPDYMGADPWWENALHRPVDAREAARDLSLFFPEAAYA